MSSAVKKPLLLLSGLLGELILIELATLKLSPDVATYSPESVRKKLTGNLLSYSDSFNIVRLNEPNFDSLKSATDLNSYSHVITADWDKTFFHGKNITLPIYHIHPSLLPRYRGYSAVSTQIKDGIAVSGISIYKENGITDSGEIVFQKTIEIEYQDIPATFIEKVAKYAASFIHLSTTGDINIVHSQDELRSSMTGRVRKKDMLIDFHLTAISLHNFIRSYSYPFSLAYLYIAGRKLYIAAAYVEKWNGRYGAVGEVIKVDENGVEVAAGDGTIILVDILDENYEKFDYTVINSSTVIG